MKKIWEGRISKKTDKLVEKFTTSIDIDGQLYKYDIVGTLAYAIGLYKIGIIKNDELRKIAEGLNKLKLNVEGKKITFDGYEDIHSLVEIELGKEAGKISEKIHTGRSRNDQVVLDERIFIKNAITEILFKILELEKSIIYQAKKNFGIIIPAYTHLQKAQPVLLSHYFLAYFEKFKRDIEKFFESFENCDALPLGAAAGTGSGYKIDREFLKEILKFKRISSNSMDDVSNRDFVIDFIYCCVMVMVHLSRLCEDLIIYNTSEFSFIDIDESFCTGSSIMPQKKNPDVLELSRGKSSIVIGNLMQVLTLIKGLPLTYNRDLQEDKKILFSAYKETKSSIDIISKLLLKINFNSNKIEENLEEGFLEATDAADYLVKKGENFRRAHNIVGEIINYCIENKIGLKDVGIDKLKEFSSYFGSDFYEYIDLKSCINVKSVDCGTSEEQVKFKIKFDENVVKNYQKSINKLKTRIPEFDEVLKYVNQLG